jgi:hypothetical protein
MPRRKRYSAEFKREAIRHANEEDVTNVLVAEDPFASFSIMVDLAVIPSITPIAQAKLPNSSNFR